jgi:hypothetical protein
MAQGDPAFLMQMDSARLRILNGTSTAQIDTRTGSYLLQRGMLVAEVGNTRSASRTTIVLYSPKLYALRFLADIFGVSRSSQILIQPDPSETVDIEVRLGNDWIDRLPSEDASPAPFRQNDQP